MSAGYIGSWFGGVSPACASPRGVTLFSSTAEPLRAVSNDQNLCIAPRLRQGRRGRQVRAFVVAGRLCMEMQAGLACRRYTPREGELPTSCGAPLVTDLLRGGVASATGAEPVGNGRAGVGAAQVAVFLQQCQGWVQVAGLAQPGSRSASKSSRSRSASASNTSRVGSPSSAKEAHSARIWAW
jgi:hypothetical protein